jgi:hypothetical protein
MHRVHVENVLEETMSYYDDKEEGALAFEQIVPGKYYRYNRDYGICEVMESASNKPKILRYLTRDGSLLGSNGDLFEVDMTDRLLAVLKERRDKTIGFIDEMGTW